MEGSRNSDRYSYEPYEQFPLDHGFMVRMTDQPKRIERTPENDHFFLWNKHHKRFELLYQGSADIVGQLELHHSVEEQHDDAKRLLSFYDIGGRYYESVFLHSLTGIETGGAGNKHSAIFQGQDGELFSIAIDSIYCLNMPQAIVPSVATPVELSQQQEDI